MIVRGRVQRGRIVVDEPTDLPEGSNVALAVVDDVLARELSPSERAELEASIAESRRQLDRGEGIDRDELFKRLRTRSP
jgi:hypothetical protein